CTASRKAASNGWNRWPSRALAASTTSTPSPRYTRRRTRCRSGPRSRPRSSSAARSWRGSSWNIERLCSRVAATWESFIYIEVEKIRRVLHLLPVRIVLDAAKFIQPALCLFRAEGRHFLRRSRGSLPASAPQAVEFLQVLLTPQGHTLAAAGGLLEP